MCQGNVNLGALIGSRICHDLISPIGAIHNGLELLDMAAAMQGPEMGLIADSVNNAEARIRFFRLAYGAAGDQLIPRSEVAGILRDVGAGSRLKAHWGPLDPQPRADVRLALLAIQCLETAMPYGGQLRVTEDDGQWRIEGTADRMTITSELWAGLTNPSIQPNITPALVQFALLPVAVQESDRDLRATTSAHRVEIAF